jgi:hypothetical protein
MKGHLRVPFLFSIGVNQFIVTSVKLVFIYINFESYFIFLFRSGYLFRNRGIKVVVDTTMIAEFDIQDHKLTDEFLESVVRSLTIVPFSNDDIVQGALRARTIQKYDVFFIVGREKSQLVVTLGGLQPHQGETALRKTLKLAEKVGIVRGATGL